MSTIARVALSHGDRLTEDSFVTIFDGEWCVAQGDVPVRTEHAGLLAPARICEAIRALGYKPVDYYNRQRKADGHVDFDVEAVA